MVVDYFTDLLNSKVKAVGVNHYVENNDISWEVTIWNQWALHALLGQMYLTRGDLVQAADHFGQIMYNNTNNLRYQLDRSFEGMNWRTIFSTIDSREHIYTLWFSKSYFQQNPFQSYFESIPPHKHMMKPTYKAVFNWETVWRTQVKHEDLVHPENTVMIRRGIPTDSIRGNGASYLYLKNDVPITEEDFDDMYRFRAAGDYRSSRAIMEGMDTIINKYSIGRTQFDQDANYIIYRAAGIHLYMAEIYAYWLAVRNDLLRTEIEEAVKIVNDGTNYSYDFHREQRGVRGRVGLGEGDDRIYVANIIYIHDPFTNEILGYRNLFGQYQKKQEQ